MWRTISNEKGLGLIEVVIAIFLTTVAVLAILALQPSAWRTAGRSDYLGRAANLLYDELQRYEATIMNPCQPIPAASASRVAYASNLGTSQVGDATFTITTTVTDLGSNTWRVTTRVAWGNHPGITESMIVTRQETYRYPPGCASQ
ncbi:MAG TPA: hypothetical protein PLT64_08350 [Syntrophales bacterium]|nr:hypothetical protein [Syntrophales bacterium]HOL59854.1 hypothetical protein [Syntrophales bacterium]HPO36001.1 hypothetical protein [Syntrophales bacterium]